MVFTIEELESILAVITHKINVMNWQHDAMRITFTKSDEQELEEMSRLKQKIVDSGLVKQKELKEDGNLQSAYKENIFD